MLKSLPTSYYPGNDSCTNNDIISLQIPCRWLRMEVNCPCRSATWFNLLPKWMHSSRGSFSRPTTSALWGEFNLGLYSMESTTKCQGHHTAMSYGRPHVPKKSSSLEPCWNQQVVVQNPFSHQLLPRSTIEGQRLVKADHTVTPMLTWQVKIGESVPCNLTPVKPKYFSLAQLSIAASSALKLKWTSEMSRVFSA